MQLLFCYNFNQNAYDPFYEKKHDHYFYGRQMDREIFKLRQIRWVTSKNIRVCVFLNM